MQNRLDLNYIIGEMIAELACGHAYVNPGEIKGPERIPMGLLGAELSRDKSGFYRIDKFYRVQFTVRNCVLPLQNRVSE